MSFGARNYQFIMKSIQFSTMKLPEAQARDRGRKSNQEDEEADALAVMRSKSLTFSHEDKAEKTMPTRSFSFNIPMLETPFFSSEDADEDSDIEHDFITEEQLYLDLGKRQHMAHRLRRVEYQEPGKVSKGPASAATPTPTLQAPMETLKSSDCAPNSPVLLQIIPIYPQKRVLSRARTYRDAHPNLPISPTDPSEPREKPLRVRACIASYKLLKEHTPRFQPTF